MVVVSRRRAVTPGGALIIEGMFPACNATNPPAHFRCADCAGPGWGPMLVHSLFRSISARSENLNDLFLCEPCMEKRLGRELRPGDIRDCPMNRFHRHYVANGEW